jgi:transcription elongation factor GreA
MVTLPQWWNAVYFHGCRSRFPVGGRLSRTTELAREERYDDLQNMWLEALPDGLSTDEMLETLRILYRNGEADLALELLELSLGEMEAAGSVRIPDLCKGAACIVPDSGLLRYHLLESLRDEYLMFEPLEFFFRESRLSSKGSDIPQSWAAFTRLMRYMKGGFVLHANFGPGQIMRVTRSSVTVNFEKSQDHDMSIEAVVSTTEPLADDSLIALRWLQRDEFEALPDRDPGSFLARLFAESGRDGQIDLQDIRYCLMGSSLNPSTVWRKLREYAGKSTEFTELGEQIVRKSESSIEAQVRSILSERGKPLSDKNSVIASILKQSGSIPDDTLVLLLDEAGCIKDCETGATFELMWLLSRGGMLREFGPKSMALVEDTASRALRAIGEMHSTVCRKTYVEAFCDRVDDREEVFRLMSELPRPLWFALTEKLYAKDKDLLSICATLFIADRGSPDRFLWTMELITKGLVSGDFPEGDEKISLILGNLTRARSDTQRRTAVYLRKELRPELESYLKRVDSRSLDGIVSELDNSSAVHETGLLLILKRELSGRKRGSSRSRILFWESDAIFDNADAIERRLREVDEIVKVAIPAAAEQIAEAASHGDLSDNAEYTAAIERRDLLLDTVRRWTEELERLRPYPEGEVSSMIVSPGTRVTISPMENIDGGELAFELVGPLEADPTRERINYMAPLGAAMLGRERGDTVTLPGKGLGAVYRVDDIEILPEVLRR